MFIRSTKSAYQPQRQAPSRPVVSKEEEVRPPFKERVVTHAIVGASLGAIGSMTTLGAAAYAGMAIGDTFGYGSLGTVVGGVVGAGAGALLEKKFPVGKTVGGAVGFISGGIVGGISGTVVAGVTSIPDLFD
mgnify:CR=1 FL=1